MIKSAKISHLPENYLPIKLEVPQKIVDQYLNNITLLQAQLNQEEKKLIQLLRMYGSEIVPDPEKN